MTTIRDAECSVMTIQYAFGYDKDRYRLKYITIFAVICYLLTTKCQHQMDISGQNKTKI